MSTYSSDYARQLGPLGMTIRLRRLSDRMVQDARRLYKELGLDIEPNWHAIILLVSDQPDLGVADIARRLRMTHPSASAVVGQLMARDYLQTIDDPNDGRRRIIRLTRKARRKLPELMKVWEAGRRAIEDAIEASGHDVLETISALEDVFNEQGYGQRSKTALAEQQSDDLEMTRAETAN